MVAVVYTVRFVTELAMLAAVALGASQFADGTAGFAIAVVAVVAAGTCWGLWIGPRSARRLPDPTRFVVEVALFAWAAVGLVLAGWTQPAAAFLLTAVAASVAIRVTGETHPGHGPDAAQPAELR